MDDVDGVDANARTVVGGSVVVVRRHVGVMTAAMMLLLLVTMLLRCSQRRVTSCVPGHERAIPKETFLPVA